MKNISAFLILVAVIAGIFWYTFRETKKEIPIEPTYKVAEKTTPTVIPDGKDWGEDPKMK